MVYDRQFYKDIFEQYAKLLKESRAVQALVPYPQPANGDALDPRRQKQQVYGNMHVGYVLFII